MQFPTKTSDYFYIEEYANMGTKKKNKNEIQTIDYIFFTLTIFFLFLLIFLLIFFSFFEMEKNLRLFIKTISITGFILLIFHILNIFYPFKTPKIHSYIKTSTRIYSVVWFIILLFLFIFIVKIIIDKNNKIRKYKNSMFENLNQDVTNYDFGKHTSGNNE